MNLTVNDSKSELGRSSRCLNHDMGAARHRCAGLSRYTILRIVLIYGLQVRFSPRSSFPTPDVNAFVIIAIDWHYVPNPSGANSLSVQETKEFESTWRGACIVTVFFMF